MVVVRRLPRLSALAVLGVGGGFAPGLGGFVLWPLGLLLRLGFGWGGVRAGPVWVRLSSRLLPTNLESIIKN